MDFVLQCVVEACLHLANVMISSLRGALLGLCWGVGRRGMSARQVLVMVILADAFTLLPPCKDAICRPPLGLILPCFLAVHYQ